MPPDDYHEHEPSLRETTEAGFKMFYDLTAKLRQELHAGDGELADMLTDLDSIVEKLQGEVMQLARQNQVLAERLTELTHCHNALSARVDKFEKK